MVRASSQSESLRTVVEAVSVLVTVELGVIVTTMVDYVKIGC